MLAFIEKDIFVINSGQYRILNHQEHLILRTDFRRERVKPLIQKILGTSLSTSLDELLISIVATLKKKSNYFTFLQAWHTWL